MQSLFKKLYLNSISQCKDEIKNVLILYEEKIVFLGDCCMQFNKFKYVKALLNNASIDINFSHKNNRKFAEGLLKNNPYLNEVSLLEDWHSINLRKYDVIFCVSYDETQILKLLDQKYGQEILDGYFKLSVYSISDLLLKREARSKYLFPVNRELNTVLKLPQPGELYLSNAEINKADKWLEEKGIMPGDKLFILLDSTSSKDKLIRMDVYFEMLSLLLAPADVKVLIYDERKVGKNVFYKEWLNKELLGKVIFSEGLTLREDIALLGSSYVSLILGPCTGLMHCASSIYNYAVECGLSLKAVPKLIVYTGLYKPENLDAGFWWGSSPLIRCLMLRPQGDKKQIEVLDPKTFNPVQQCLPCTEYTADLLLDYISASA